MRKFTSMLVEKLLSLGASQEAIDKINKSNEESLRASSKAVIWARREAELVELGLIDELRGVGIEIKDAWELVNTREPYPEAVPILVRHLKLPYDDDNKDAIARSLAVPYAKEYWDELLMEYRKASGRVKDGLACALAVIGKATKRYNEILGLLRDETLDDSRIFFLSVISSARDPKISAHLEEFADHPLLGIQTRIILKRRNRRKKT